MSRWAVVVSNTYLIIAASRCILSIKLTFASQFANYVTMLGIYVRLYGIMINCIDAQNSIKDILHKHI